MIGHKGSRVKVAVIIPCYNVVRYVEQTVASVRAQTLTDWETVLVNDGSTDETASVLDALVASDPRIRALTQPNQGLSGARNSGARLASDSEYLLFLDADDLLDSTMLATMTEHLDRHSAAVLAYCRVDEIDAEGRLLPSRSQGSISNCLRFIPKGAGYALVPPSTPVTPLASLMADHEAIPSTCVFRTRAFWRTGGWDSSFAYFADKDKVIHMATLGEVHHIARKLVRYRRHNTSLTSIHSATRLPWKELRAIDNKWWIGKGLSASQRDEMQAAILFEYWLAMLHQLAGILPAVRRGELYPATRLLLHAVNHGRRFLTRYCQQRLYAVLVPTPTESVDAGWTPEGPGIGRFGSEEQPSPTA